MLENLRITKCLQGIVKRKAIILIGLVLLSFTSFKASAHAVQVGYVVLPNGFIRVYIEHWHGALSTSQLVGNGMSITTTYGSTTVTQNVNPTGAFNGYNWNNLPGAGTNIIILATSGSANRQNNWAYYDFAPAACNVPVKITLNGGLTVVLTESEPQIWPQTISGTFNDNAAPSITPRNTNTTVACGISGANVNFSATAIDNCTPNPAVTFSVPPGSFFPVGTTPVTAYSSDANGNSGQLTFNVTVSVVDHTAPTISCPANISVGTDPGSCSAIVNYALPTFSDNCGVASIQQTGGLLSGSVFPQGNTTNSFKVTDGSGNFTTCSFVVTVTDDIVPTAVCQNKIIALNADLTASITVEDINNSSYDNCGPVSVSISSGKTQFDCNDIGKSFPVTLLVKDQQGLTSSCTAQVTVTDPNSYCNQPPVAACKPLSFFANENCNAIVTAADFDNGSTDPNGDAISFSVYPIGPYTIGITNVTLTVTDSKGASSSCVTTVTVIDNTAPVISNRQSNISVVTGAGRTTCDQVATWVAPTATDNCGTVTVSSDHNSGDVFPVETTVVTYTFTDAHANTSTCSFNVTVIDNTAPVVSGCPGIITVVTGAGRTSCDQVATWFAPTAIDNCGTVTVTSNHNSGEVFPVGTTAVTYTFTDGHSNTSTCSFNVTIVDNTAPIASCKPVTVTLVNGVALVTAADVNSFSSDNCGPVTIALSSVSKTSYTCADGGKTFPVTLIVTDSHNNVSTCIAQVTVTGEIPTCSIASVPTSTAFTGGNPLNLYLGYGAQSTTLKVTPAANGAPYTYSWSGPVSLLSSSTSAAPVFTSTVAGQYTFTVTTTNKYGCAATCSIIICVTDIRVAGTNGSKVYVCHVPPGNPGNPNTLSISVNAVPAHLGNHAGDRLGSCDQSPCSAGPVTHASTQSSKAASKEQQESNDNEAFTVVVSPNPSTTYFTLKLKSKYQTPVSMKVMDANGRVIDAASKIAPNSSIQIGHNYISGSYYAEMIQGNTRKVVQLIKVK